MAEAPERTSRWINRCFSAHSRQGDQVLFPIVQGGIDPDLRNRSLDELLKVDAHGYAIGGLSGGENKDDFFKIVKLCCDRLPADRPRYLMGVGYPVDLVLCAALGGGHVRLRVCHQDGKIRHCIHLLGRD
jgi:tRNA-guanine family transglycosylase